MSRFSIHAICTALLLLLAGQPAVAQTEARTTEFSGYTWELRRSSGLEGPGPNRFLDNRRSIWVDDQGDLHLKIWGRLGNWYAAEVVLTESLGYGTYIFETIGEIDRMDPPVILGMFTYDHNPEYDYREIDIEYGLFGAEGGPNAQFVLQPFDKPGNRMRFDARLDGSYQTHAFTWAPDQIVFASYHGHRSAEVSGGDLRSVPDEYVIRSWVFSGDVPPPGEERVHLNLWLYQGEAPDRDHEVVFRSFEFVPPAME